MNTHSPSPGLWARTVGDIAATLPGATIVFRKYKIDFCCKIAVRFIGEWARKD